MAQKLYAVSLQAERRHSGDVEAVVRSARAQAIGALPYVSSCYTRHMVVHTGTSVLAESIAEAERLAKQLVKKIFPEEEGWRFHTITAEEVLPEVIAEAA